LLVNTLIRFFHYSLKSCEFKGCGVERETGGCYTKPAFKGATLEMAHNLYVLMLLCRQIFFVCFGLVFSAVVLANSIGIHEFSSDEQRASYVSLVQQIRCPKCQNQNILDSNSQISIDLRNQVARLLKEGQSEDEIKVYLVNRYSDFVLYEPPLNMGTMLLWYGPVIMFLLGLMVFYYSVQRRRRLAVEKPEDASDDDLAGNTAIAVDQPMDQVDTGEETKQESPGVNDTRDNVSGDTN